MKYDLFSTLTRKGIYRTWKDYTYLLKQHAVNTEKLKEYKKITNIYPSSHLLYKIFNALLRGEYNRYSIVDNVYEEGFNLAANLNITTPYVEKAPSHTAIFGGRNSEQWFAYMSPSNAYSDSVENLIPIRCLWHPMKSMNLWMTEDESIELSNDIATFTVNLPDAAIAVNHYIHSKEGNKLSTFISNVIMPDIINQISYITIFNRYASTAYSKLIDQEDSRDKPTWYDIERDMNEQHKKITEEGNRRTTSASELLNEVQVGENKYLGDLLEGFPSVPHTQPINITMLNAAMPYLRFLLSYGKGSNLNREFKNKINLYIRTLNIERSLTSRYPQTEQHQKRYLEILEPLLN